MANMMVESTNQMIERWATQINTGNPELDVEKEIIATAGDTESMEPSCTEVAESLQKF